MILWRETNEYPYLIIYSTRCFPVQLNFVWFYVCCEIQYFVYITSWLPCVMCIEVEAVTFLGWTACVRIRPTNLFGFRVHKLLKGLIRSTSVGHWALGRTRSNSQVGSLMDHKSQVGRCHKARKHAHTTSGLWASSLQQAHKHGSACKHAWMHDKQKPASYKSAAKLGERTPWPPSTCTTIEALCCAPVVVVQPLSPEKKENKKETQ